MAQISLLTDRAQRFDHRRSQHCKQDAVNLPRNLMGMLYFGASMNIQC